MELGTKKYVNMIYVENHPLQKTQWLENGEIELSPELNEMFSSCRKERVEAKEKRPRGRPRIYFKKEMPRNEINSFFKENSQTIKKKRGRPKKIDMNSSDDSDYSNDGSLTFEETCTPGPSFEPDFTYDYPEKILKVKYLDGIKYFLTEWKIRSDGLKADTTYVPAEIMKRNYEVFYDEQDFSLKFN
jgi:hypothetical protein